MENMENQSKQVQGGQPAQSGQPNTPTGSSDKVMGVLAYIIFFIPLLTSAKNDPFVKYHVKQGLMVFLIALAGGILGSVLYLLAGLVQLFVLVMVVLGIINVLNDKKEPLPLIGQYAEKFNF
ncbi:MAG: hypothetical protein COU31_01195 [Candidatus Magasanikbacteria bacterium CG10_big_fil_rev_8_21_14_0_10_40_10]|uniref:DUF4870 domain-containing protein n=1 Tax=Candidatus Magasanikbacteria bacterium CG10_big_fil_rev_8_21_14_0_10_40_10 TaxID=1974648 RepID=A0A2M6W4W4_9BACT|nr:MAG: hypothetical protein COU31_01195 [Candidatus Magasanikbacteria bacterium CG10_big_fil_rev_8_21_14_0_10_40_10]